MSYPGRCYNEVTQRKCYLETKVSTYCLFSFEPRESFLHKQNYLAARLGELCNKKIMIGAKRFFLSQMKILLN